MLALYGRVQASSCIMALVTTSSPFFRSMGFEMPERKGVADFLQEITSRKDQKVCFATGQPKLSRERLRHRWAQLPISQRSAQVSC